MLATIGQHRLPDRALDNHGLDLLCGRSIFTDDALVTFPSGEHRGLDAVVTALMEGMGQFGPTQHSGSNYLVELDGDRAPG